MIKVLVHGLDDGAEREAREATARSITATERLRNQSVAHYVVTGPYEASLKYALGANPIDVLVIEGSLMQWMVELALVLSEAHGELKPAYPVPDTDTECVTTASHV